MQKYPFTNQVQSTPYSTISFLRVIKRQAVQKAVLLKEEYIIVIIWMPPSRI